MKHSLIWFSPSRIIWWPSIFDMPSNRQTSIDWLKWKIVLFFDDGDTFAGLKSKIKAAFGWSLVAILFFATFALWCISEGLWTR